MKQRCAGCGYTSTTPSFFRSEKEGAFGGRKVFCNGCAPYARTIADRASTTRFLIALLLLPSGLFIFAALPKALPLGMGLALAGAISAAHPLTIAVHEFGHWCAARLVGYKVVRVTVGTGPTITARLCRGTLWELRRFLFSGGQTLSYSESDAPQKWRQAVMLVGGVTANALAAATLIAVLVWHIKRGGPTSPTVLAILAGATVSQLLVFASSLWPRRITGHADIRGTDGQLLLDLYKEKDFAAAAARQRFYVENRELIVHGLYDEAAKRCEALLRSRPGDTQLFARLLHVLERAQGAQAAFQYFQSHASEFEGKSAQEMAWIQANAAWHALLSGDAKLVSDARQLSEQAFETAPAAPEIRGTRGAYLVCTNNYKRALPMLLGGVRQVQDTIDRSDFAKFLARCYAGLGNAEFAAECEKLAAHLRESQQRNATAATAG